jgi:hypothetical protein
MNHPSGMTAISAEDSFSPIDNEPPLRWQRKLGLAPANGLGVMRRAMLLAALTWFVPVIWAALNHRLWEGVPGESLLQHFGIHARFLLAVVLLVIAEATVHKGLTRIVMQFTESGVIGVAARAPFERVLQSMRRLRDITLPWALLFGLVLAWTIMDTPEAHTDALSWALDRNGQLGFGGWWVAYVSRPIFVALLLAWLWRLLLVVILFARIGRLDLSLVPTHPDRAGGLDFVQALPGAFAPVSLALSAAISAQWAHDIVYHAVTLQALKLSAIAFVVISAFLWLLPLLMLAPALLAAKRRARPAYAALVGEHGRMVHRRWILREPVADSTLLEAAEIGPVADTAAIYHAVVAMRPAPVGRRAIVAIVLPIALPMLLAAALQIPLKDIVLKLLKALV